MYYIWYKNFNSVFGLSERKFLMYNKIKKQNGERFAKAIRAYDNGIFDVPDLDKIVKYAGRDAEPLMNYLVSLKDIKIEEHGVYQDPKDLAELAGYDYYHVTSQDEVLKFRKYYAKGEELCTFRDELRTDMYHVIWLVKKDYDKIGRGASPNRDDPYGTSVMSIQMLKSGGFISIKNRYNHTVKNPDNTLNSNPDNIIEGLSQALKHKYNVDFSSLRVALPENYVMMNGKVVKYRHEHNNVYLGDNFYAKNGQVFEVDKNKEIMIENFVLNVQTKEIKNVFNNDKDAFGEALANEIEGRKLQIIKNEKGNKCLLADGVEILEIKGNQVASLNFVKTTEVGDYFLVHAKSLTNASMPNLRKMGNHCLRFASSLEHIYMPNLIEMGNNCFEVVGRLPCVSMEMLIKMGKFCFYRANSIINVSMPNLKEMKNFCFKYTNSLVNVAMQRLEKTGRECFYKSKALARALIPKEIITKYMKEFIKKNSYPKVVDMAKNQVLLNASQNIR